ncbi:MAG: MBL fold metallo-hydrolase RNA specificity domain-containing protein [Eubacteriales bacterium]|nr:MBL fold metallo-hydrolase RNA specificity domain-containing protein [Eubacteriales bacterium]
MEGFSAHADMNGLLDWLRGFQKAPKEIFLVHGEPDAKLDFAKTVKDQLGYDTIPVIVNSEYELEIGGSEVNSMKEAIAEAIDLKKINDTRDNLCGIRRRLEDIIYNTNLKIEATRDPEKIARINNLILELDKFAINLEAIISEGDEEPGIQLSDEQIAKLRQAENNKNAGAKRN